MSGRIILGECLETMATLPDGSVDMVLADLPYGTTNLSWDSVIDLPEFWKQVKRVTRNGAIVAMTAQQPFATSLINSNASGFKYEWIWEKTCPTGFLGVAKCPLRLHENILVFGVGGNTEYNPQKIKVKQKTFGHGKKIAAHYAQKTRRDPITHNGGQAFPSTIIRISNRNFEAEHPTQKPVPLFEYLIRTYTNEGDTVLDPTCGSGTTAVACIKSNRNYICIERDPGFHAIAERRARDVHPDLFIPHE